MRICFSGNAFISRTSSYCSIELSCFKHISIGVFLYTIFSRNSSIINRSSAAVNMGLTSEQK
jgi:hypothetical protein